VHDASRRPIRPGVRAFAVDLEKSIPGSLVCNTCNPRGFPAMGRAILSSPREAGDGSYFSSMNSAGLCRSRCVGSRAVVVKCAARRRAPRAHAATARRSRCVGLEGKPGDARLRAPSSLHSAPEARSRAVVAKCAGPPCAKGLCAAHVGARHCYAMSFAGAVTASQK